MHRPGMRLSTGYSTSGRQPTAHRRIRGTLAALLTGLALLSGCTPSPGPNPAIHLGPNLSAASLNADPNVPGDPNIGRQLFTDSKFYPPSGCASCHTLRNVSSGIYPGAPNLTNVSLRPTLADNALQNTPEQMKAWIMDPPSQKPNAKMPKLQNMTDADAENLTAFLYSQPFNPEQ